MESLMVNTSITRLPQLLIARNIEKYKIQYKGEYPVHVERLNKDLIWLSLSGFVGEYLGCESFPEILFLSLI